MKRLAPISLFLFFISYCQLGSQETPRVISFLDQGVFNDQAWSITQIDDQRVFFGTSDGLLSFDGTNWQVFPATLGTVVRSVATDTSGQLFSGSYNEFGYWQLDELHEWHYHSLSNDIIKTSNSREEIWHILKYKGSVYFQSFSTIYKFKNGIVSQLTPPGNIMFLQVVKDQLLVQQINGGIYILDESDQFHLLPQTNFFQDKKIVFILPHNGEHLLIGTEKHGLFIWQEEGDIIEWSSALQGSLKSKQINKGLQLSDGSLVVGTILDGVFIIDPSGKKEYHLNKKNGLPDNTILSLAEDQNGNLWIGTDSGIALVDLQGPLLFYRDLDGNLGTVFSAALLDSILYLGTNHGVFYREADPQQPKPFTFIEGTQGQVWELNVYNNELLCGHNDGTFSITSLVPKQISSFAGGWTTTPIDKRAAGLIQGTYSGIVVFEHTESRGWLVKQRLANFSEPVKELEIDHNGILWVAHPIEGLHRITLDSAQTKILAVQKMTLPDSLSQSNRLQLLQSEGKIYVKTAHTWFQYDELKAAFTKEATFKNFPLAKIKGHILNGRASDWFEILPGNLIYHSTSNTVNYMVSLVSRFENIVSLDSNRYLFCLEQGYAIFDPTQIDVSKWEASQPKVKIHKLEVYRQDSSRSIDWSKQPLILKNAENRIHFSCYQPLFTNKPLFRYRLEGLDENWSEWTENAEKEYLNLPPGQYIFSVSTRHGAHQASLSFQISPHWSQTPLAMVLYGTLLLGFMMLVRGFYRNRLLKAQQQMIVEQERMLREQRIQAENEKLQADIVNKSKDLANSTINLARKNEILLQIKKELRQLRQSPNVELPGKEYQRLLNVIDINLTSEQDWELFEKNFNQVHDSFFKKLKTAFPELTTGDLQLAAYLKMNLSSKEIAPLLHISIRGVENKRYRLRKKLNLPSDTNLAEFMLQY